MGRRRSGGKRGGEHGTSTTRRRRALELLRGGASVTDADASLRREFGMSVSRPWLYEAARKMAAGTAVSTAVKKQRTVPADHPFRRRARPAAKAAPRGGIVTVDADNRVIWLPGGNAVTF